MEGVLMRRLLAVLIISLACATQTHAGTAFYDPIYGMSTTSDIIYGTGAINGGAGTANLLLDLYRPTDIGQGALPAQSPGIVLIHGGKFVDGDKADLAPYAEAYVSYGYTVASINYRLLGDNVPANTGPADDMIMPSPPYATLSMPLGTYTVNAAVEDATKAMIWMRSNAGLYGIDADHIAIGGRSAGAITALLQAYNAPVPQAAPQAVLSFIGSMYGTEDSIQAGGPPAFVVNGDADTVVPFTGPSSIQGVIARMNEVGVYNEFYVQEGLGHTTNFDLLEEDGQTLSQHNGEFLRQFLRPKPSRLTLSFFAFLALLLSFGLLFVVWRKIRGLRRI
jgi:acetyl esterase/lipase